MQLRETLYFEVVLLGPDLRTAPVAKALVRGTSAAFEFLVRRECRSGEVRLFEGLRGQLASKRSRCTLWKDVLVGL